MTARLMRARPSDLIFLTVSAAGMLIYALMEKMEPKDIVDFAVATSVIKHTIHGDFNIIDDKQSIYNLMKQEYEIKR